jgi:hypothetical protein
VESELYKTASPKLDTADPSLDGPRAEATDPKLTVSLADKSAPLLTVDLIDKSEPICRQLRTDRPSPNVAKFCKDIVEPTRIMLVMLRTLPNVTASIAETCPDVLVNPNTLK